MARCSALSVGFVEVGCICVYQEHHFTVFIWKVACRCVAKQYRIFLHNAYTELVSFDCCSTMDLNEDARVVLNANY